MYSEKTTKFYGFIVTTSTVEISQTFLAFSEYMRFLLIQIIKKEQSFNDKGMIVQM